MYITFDYHTKSTFQIDPFFSSYPVSTKRNLKRIIEEDNYIINKIYIRKSLKPAQKTFEFPKIIITISLFRFQFF